MMETARRHRRAGAMHSGKKPLAFHVRQYRIQQFQHRQRGELDEVADGVDARSVSLLSAEFGENLGAQFEGVVALEEEVFLEGGAGAGKEVGIDDVWWEVRDWTIVAAAHYGGGGVVGKAWWRK